MAKHIGVWIDHRQAVIVGVSDTAADTRVVRSAVTPHPRFAGAQDGGGEQKYEERHQHRLDRFLDDVMRELTTAEAVLILGPGAAKHALKARIASSRKRPKPLVEVKAADRLTRPRIVARIKRHYGIRQPRLR
jgi:hypothetical protein